MDLFSLWSPNTSTEQHNRRMWKNCGERRTLERHVENSALQGAEGPVWVCWTCRISGNACPQGIPTFCLILLPLSKGIIAPVQRWQRKRGKITPCLPAHMLLIPEKSFIGLTNLCNSWLTHHVHCLCIQENVTAWIFFLCVFFSFYDSERKQIWTWFVSCQAPAGRRCSRSTTPSFSSVFFTAL